MHGKGWVMTIQLFASAFRFSLRLKLLPNLYFLLLSVVLISCGPMALAQLNMVYLGTDPATIMQIPAGAASVSAFGVDSGKNSYFVNSAEGKLLKRAKDGVVTTIATNVGNASIAVNWRGDVTVADSMHNRLLLEKVTASGYQESVLATIASPHSLVADNKERIFFLSGTALYDLSSTGTPEFLGDIPNAVELALGPPNSSGAKTIYALSNGAGGYQSTVYTYSDASPGSFSAPVAIPSPGAIAGFRVDSMGNYLLKVPSGSGYQIYSVAGPTAYTPGFTNVIYTSATAADLFSFDAGSNLYFASSGNVARIQFGDLDFGVSVWDGNPYDPSASISLNYAEPPDGDAFYDFEMDWYGPFSPSYRSDMGSDRPCMSYQGFCKVDIRFFPEIESSRTGVIYTYLNSFSVSGVATVGNTNVLGAALISQKLAGAPLLQKPTYLAVRETDWQSSFWVADKATSALLYVDSSNHTAQTVASGLTNVNSLNMDYDGGIYEIVYVTQMNVPGVKKITSGGAPTQILTQFEHPQSFTIDRFRNYYVGNDDAIYVVRASSGSTSVLADPGSDLGLHNLVTLKSHALGDIYAAYSSGGEEGRGGIVKIDSASGKITKLSVAYDKIASLGVDLGGNLYVSDPGRKTVTVYTATGNKLDLLTGLTSVAGVAVQPWGLYAVADTGASSIVTSASDQRFDLDFGNVPVGVTSKHSFYVLNTATEDTNLSSFSYDDNPDFTISEIANIKGGDLALLDFTFTPHQLGSSMYSFLLEGKYSYLSHVYYFSLTSGNGVAATLAPARFFLSTSTTQTSGNINVRVLATDNSGKPVTGLTQYLLLKYSGPVSGGIVVPISDGVGTVSLPKLPMGVYQLSIEEGAAKGQGLVTVRSSGVPIL